jgi:hypothetical protein
MFLFEPGARYGARFERISPVEDFIFPFLEYHSDILNTVPLEDKEQIKKTIAS